MNLSEIGSIYLLRTPTTFCLTKTSQLGDSNCEAIKCLNDWMIICLLDSWYSCGDHEADGCVSRRNGG